MRRRISGVDVNGWKDAAARDWKPDDVDERTNVIDVLNGGVGSVAVRQNWDKGWVGGPQAILAPHGRGIGWGDIGDATRRVEITDICESFSLEGAQDQAIYSAAVSALSRGAEGIVLAVPDVANFDEAAQDNALNSFGTRRAAHRLLWRPVAAFIYALTNDAIPRSADGEIFRFLIHVGSGFEVQTLRLRRDVDHAEHMAPERDGSGVMKSCNVGLASLKRRADERVLARNPILAEGACERSRLGLNLLCDEQCDTREILRRNNSNWFEVLAPEIEPQILFSDIDLGCFDDFASMADVSRTFLLTPLAEPYRQRLLSLLRKRISTLHSLDWNAIATGSLIAGRWIDQGLPHYFDRLTPISLAVLDQKSGEPLFEDLIGTDATLPANREYVSPPFQSLEWLAGKREIEFYILKGNDEVRHWQVSREPPAHNVRVELRIRQTPGQSWAKLSLTSPDWEPLQRAPITLDWANLKPVSATPSEILERLKTPPPTIPARIVEASNLVFWKGSDRISGILPTLDEAERRGRVSASAIAPLLARSVRDPNTRARFRPVSTDGEMPKGLSAHDRKRFGSAIHKLEAETLAETLLTPSRDNDALRCLTWTFTYCPESIQDAIVDALDADLAGRKHPLLGPATGRLRVLTEGAGRSVTGAQRLSRLLHILVAREQNANTLNALAMILSRREEAPYALTPDLVEQIAEHTARELVMLTEKLSFAVRFRNTLSTVAGLFRYREVEPFALVASRDPIARKLLNSIERAEKSLIRNRHKVKFYEERSAALMNISDFLNGGGDPNILISIENMEDD